MANKGCYICRKPKDKYCLWATPNGKKFKVCNSCIKLANLFMAAQEEQKDETVASETTE